MQKIGGQSYAPFAFGTAPVKKKFGMASGVDIIKVRFKVSLHPFPSVVMSVKMCEFDNCPLFGLIKVTSVSMLVPMVEPFRNHS